MNMPTNRASRRRYKKRHGRSVWVFSEVNQDITPEDIARILTSAGLERARLEAEAQAEDQGRAEGAERKESSDE